MNFSDININKKILFEVNAKDNVSNKIIKNINVPSCKNCIHYKLSSFDNDFNSRFNKCYKFGEKNIITDEIIYDYVDSCRKDESKCGYEGKYFEEDKYIDIKILKYKIFNRNNLFFLPIIFSIIYNIKYVK
jgi:hypothetical protein